MPKMLAALYNGVDTVEIKRIDRLEPGPGDALVQSPSRGYLRLRPQPVP